MTHEFKILIAGVIAFISMNTFLMLLQLEHSHELVDEVVDNQQVETQYICDNILVYKYYIDGNVITDAETGHKYLLHICEQLDMEK